MFKRIHMAAVALLFMASTLCAQTAGSVVKVDLKKSEVTVRVDKKNHVVDASSVKILDADGKEATLSSLSKGDKVSVVIEKGAVTSIRKEE